MVHIVPIMFGLFRPTVYDVEIYGIYTLTNGPIVQIYQIISWKKSGLVYIHSYLIHAPCFWTYCIKASTFNLGLIQMRIAWNSSHMNNSNSVPVNCTTFFFQSTLFKGYLQTRHWKCKTMIELVTIKSIMMVGIMMMSFKCIQSFIGLSCFCIYRSTLLFFI